MIRSLFTAIKSRKSALRTIKDCSTLLYFLAASDAIAALFLPPIFMPLFMDAFFLAASGIFIRYWESRVAAFLLIVYATVAFGFAAMFLMSASSVEEGAGSAMTFAVVTFWIGFKSFEATTKLHGAFKSTIEQK